jgi:hypothetical protein
LNQDKAAPTIIAYNFNIKNQKISRSQIAWKIQDATTSIESYDLYVDGIWKPVYYDNKSDTIGFEIPKNFSGKHQFKVVASDYCKNKQVWEATLNIE